MQCDAVLSRSRIRRRICLLVAMLVVSASVKAAPEQDLWQAAWTILQKGAPETHLEAWPCLRSGTKESLGEAEAFLRRIEGWSGELRSLPSTEFDQRLRALLAIRGAAIGSFCYGNLVVADTLTRIGYVAVVERGVAERETVAQFASTTERLRSELPLDGIEALAAAEAGLVLPAREADCERLEACRKSRLEALMRGLVKDPEEFWARLRPEDMGAYRLLREPSLTTLLFRAQQTDELVSLLQAAPATRVALLANDVRSGTIALQRGFDFSPFALVAARSSALQSAVALARGSIFQFEPAPLVLRLKNPGGPFAIVRPATLPTGTGEGPAYPVRVLVRRQGHEEVQGVQLVPPERSEERVRLDAWLLQLPSGDLEVPLSVSAAQTQLSEPLFAEPGVYSLSIEYRPVPESDVKERRIREQAFRAAGAAELTVQELAGPDLTCWRRIASSQYRWVLYDPYGAYIDRTPTMNLEAARTWVESVRPGCAGSLFRRYLDFARLLIRRELADRLGAWTPEASDMALLENLASSPAFSFSKEAQDLFKREQARQP